MRLSTSLLAAALTLATASPCPAWAQGNPSGATGGRSNESFFEPTATRAELLEMARAAVNLEQHALAEVYYREILLRNAADVTAMWELADMYRRTGKLEYARGLLTRAGALQPGRHDIDEARREVERDLFAAVSTEVRGLMASGQYEAALPRLAVLLSIDGENATALAWKARCLSALGQDDAALSNIQLAIARDPRNEFHLLRDEIAQKAERHRIGELERSARALLESGDWAREEATEVLQALLAQDPSNEWAREQFRALSGSPAQPAAPPGDPPAPRQVVDAVREVAPGFATLLNNHLRWILAFVALLVFFRSPLARALASRVRRPVLFAGDLGRINVADVLRVAHAGALTGVVVLRTPGGTARVYLENGEPVHCQAFKLTGTQALFCVVREVDDGRFDFRTVRRMPEPTIDQPLALFLSDGTVSPAGKPAPRPRRKSRMSELLETKHD